MKVICCGDSNTFGYDPRSRAGEPYDADARWVDLLAAVSGWEVINQGINGREVPGAGEVSCPEDVDLLIVILGTNDLLQLSFPEDTARRMEDFVANFSPEEKKKLLLIAPPSMVPGEWVQDDSLIEDSLALSRCYEALAQRQGIRFVNAGNWSVPMAYDGVHFTEEGHRVFAKKLYEFLCPWEGNQIPCISVENMRLSDAYTIAGFVPSLTLMHRAAMGVFKAAGWQGRTAILAGSGNNGGDGFALACILKEKGYDCTVYPLSSRLSGDSAFYAEKARQLGVPVIPYAKGCLKGFDTLVDCLLGTGFQGALRDNYRQAIAEINSSGAFVVSVDINSGMNGDSGEGELAVRSDLTVTIGYVKRGLIGTNAGRCIKRLVCADIGILLAKEEGWILPETEPIPQGDGYFRCPHWLDMTPIDSKDK